MISAESINFSMVILNSQNSKNINTMLSRNMLGIIIEFSDFLTIFEILKVNKKFKKVISSDKLFCDFIEERNILNKIENIQPILYFPENNYFLNLNNKLQLKFTPTQIDYFLTEIMKILIKKVTVDGKLNLEKYSLGSKFMITKLLFEAIKSSSTISYLNLGNNSLGSSRYNCIKLLCEAIKLNSSITRLELFDNEIGKYVKHIKLLSEALKVNQTIKYLYLGSNSLGSNVESLKLFGDAINKNSTIKCINLGNNSLRSYEDNINFLVEALKSNRTISRLNIADNKIRLDDIEKLKAIRSDLLIFY